MCLNGVSMIDLFGIVGLIIGSALATKHFGLGLPFLLAGLFILVKGDKNADKYMELVGSLAMVSIVVTFIIAFFVNYF